MRYDAVRSYADKEHHTYSRFNLPATSNVPSKCGELGHDVSKPKKVHKSNHVVEKKMPVASVN